MKLTPKDVKEYADKDSRALMEVELDDILYELKIRATESRTMTKMYVIEQMRKVADEAMEIYQKSISDNIRSLTPEEIIAKTRGKSDNK
jgi:hypothetical protein